MDPKNDPGNLFLKGYEKEQTDQEEYVDLSDMPLLEGDEEEEKEGKEVKT